MDGASSSRQDISEELFPGIPDELTLEHILTRVSWRTLFGLVPLNRRWRRAIQEREVYNVRKNRGQTLIAFSENCHRQQGFYDLEEGRMLHLPPRPRIPSLLYPGNVHNNVGVVMLDGRMYVLGDFSYASGARKRREVHVLDLGGCRLVWEQLFSSSRVDSTTSLCVACDGKIFAFSMREKEIHGEIYDPATDFWTQIQDKPLNVCKIFTYDGRVANLNKEIYVSSVGEKVMIFNCLTQKWRAVRNSISSRKIVSWVVIDEKLYNLSECRVEVYDAPSNSWAMVQPIVYKNFKHEIGITPYPVTVAPFGNEVLALLEHDITFSDGSFRKLCKSAGFGIPGHPLVWEAVPWCDLQASLNTHNNFLLGTVKL